MTRTSAAHGTSSSSGPGVRSRKSARKRKGASTVLQLATGDFIRSEKEEERACDRLVFAMGGDVIRFSQSRATHQTEGIPDRRYRVKGMAFWFEVKADDGKLTRDQWRFLEAERVCGGSAGGCGTLADLRLALVGLTIGGGAGLAESLRLSVDRYALKGFRGEPRCGHSNASTTTGDERHAG